MAATRAREPPRKLLEPISRRPPTSSAAPAKATNIPAINVRVMFSFRKIFAPSVTNNGAKFARKVELATGVNCNDQCQIARSAVKNNPARASRKKSLRADGRHAFALLDRSAHIQAQSNGRANKRRKNAVALGPT